MITIRKPAPSAVSPPDVAHYVSVSVLCGAPIPPVPRPSAAASECGLTGYRQSPFSTVIASVIATSQQAGVPVKDSRYVDTTWNFAVKY